MSSKLVRLRQLLKARDLVAYVIVSGDAHASEYVAPRDMRRAYLTEFTGSAGTAVVTETQALLWTDGRYTTQARQEMSDDWTLFHAGTANVPTINDWLVAENPEGGKVGLDPALTGIGSFQAMETVFEAAAADLTVELVVDNLIDELWGEEQPAIPQEPVHALALEFTGQSTLDKLAAVRAALVEKKAAALVVADLAEVAWLLNLRGADVEFNPVFFSFVLVLQDAVHVFLDQTKLSTEAAAALGEAKVTLHTYESFYTTLKTVTSKTLEETDKVWIDPNNCNVQILQSIGKSQLLSAMSPIQMLKAVKNSVELAGARACHVRDGVAVVRYLCWLDTLYVTDKPAFEALTEYTAAEQLAAFRGELAHFKGLSFATISGMNGNGAIIHYHGEEKIAAPLTDGMYLCDSGGQYSDGTTDITRTVCFGKPTPFQKRAFTRVLQGNIGLTRAIFPPTVTGPQLDTLARAPLWSEGLEFMHGTGHGIGAFLNVHEGPHGISGSANKSRVASTKFVSGMLVTNEPGYYHVNEFGIRIENVMEVVEKKTNHNFNDKQYLGFNTITLAPIQTQLIETELLAPEQVQWLNTYHEECLAVLGPLLSTEAERAWLTAACQPIIQ